MKNSRGIPLREALRQAAPLPPPKPAEEFWTDFRARTALTVQEAPDRVTAVGHRLVSLRWATAAAALVALAAVVVTLLRPPAEPVRVALVPPPAPAPTLSKVEEVEVFAEYSSVMIVEDVENGGTVIWVASADTGSLP